jgi:hypothetical protein
MQRLMIMQLSIAHRKPGTPHADSVWTTIHKDLFKSLAQAAAFESLRKIQNLDSPIHIRQQDPEHRSVIVVFETLPHGVAEATQHPDLVGGDHTGLTNAADFELVGEGASFRLQRAEIAG